MNSKRAYSMGVRAERAAATRQRILDAARELFVDPSTDFTLEQIATMAGVSVQTVLRAFGNREALILEAIGTVRSSREPVVLATPPRSIAEAVTQLFDDYEEIGDRVIRMLAEEHRVAGFAEVAAEGRAMHRQWVEAAFAEQLATHSGSERGKIIVALVAATDVYVWKLLRRDLGLDRTAATRIVVRLAKGALSNDRGQ